MIELYAEGPMVESHENGIDHYDGHDRITGTVTIEPTRDVQITLEFPHGHVNLESFAPSVGSASLKEIFGPYVEHTGMILHRQMFPSNEWSIWLLGEWYDWVQQAHRYMGDRERLSLQSALRKMGTWEETSSEDIAEAIERVDDVDASNAPLETLDDAEREKLREELNGLPEVDIPESYTNDVDAPVAE